MDIRVLGQNCRFLDFASLFIYYVIHVELCTKIWKSDQWPWDWKRAIFITLPKKGDLSVPVTEPFH